MLMAVATSFHLLYFFFGYWLLIGTAKIIHRASLHSTISHPLHNYRRGVLRDINSTFIWRNLAGWRGQEQDVGRVVCWQG